MNIAVIGSNSLLASYLIDEFARSNHSLDLFAREDRYTGIKHSFIYFSLPEKTLNFNDLLDYDAIIYCAAAGVQSGQKVSNELIYKVNATLPIDIISFLEDHEYAGKWISFGSCFEIGNNNNYRSFTENELVGSELQVPNHYCSSKRVLTRYMSSGLIKGRFWHFVLPTIYGALENPNRLIPYIVNALKSNKPLQLSAGKQIRQYVHCKDVASLATMILNGNYPTGIYNVAADEGIRIADLVETVFNLFKKDPTPYLGTLVTRDESMQVLRLNMDKLSSGIPDWKPAFTLKAGIQEYL